MRLTSMLDSSCRAEAVGAGQARPVRTPPPYVPPLAYFGPCGSAPTPDPSPTRPLSAIASAPPRRRCTRDPPDHARWSLVHASPFSGRITAPPVPERAMRDGGWPYRIVLPSCVLLSQDPRGSASCVGARHIANSPWISLGGYLAIDALGRADLGTAQHLAR